MPGRKTDLIDAEWIARLIRYGLVRPNFVPPQPIREMRDLTRYRRTLMEAQASERRRLIKLLEAADTKLAEVLSDVFGVTGRAILRALIEGTSSPAQMAALAKGIARKKIAPLTAALAGQLAEHQRFILQVQLRRIGDTEQQIAWLDQQIEARSQSYRAEIALLISIPGIDRVGAGVILAEIGADMSAFATADRQENAAASSNSTRLGEKIERLKVQMQRLRDLQIAVKAAPDEQISWTDPDARSMATSGKGTGIVGYNMQAAVDAKHHLIVAHDVTNVGHDREELARMATQAKDAMGHDQITAVADRGYFLGCEIYRCEQAGIVPYVPKPLTSRADSGHVEA